MRLDPAIILLSGLPLRPQAARPARISPANRSSCRRPEFRAALTVAWAAVAIAVQMILTGLERYLRG